MATVFSTATLGLNVDTKEFNKQLRLSQLTTVKALQDMQEKANAFDASWKAMTGGIKDTKRIISGILISQGFYALMNAFTAGAGAALEFSSAMESASVSLEYFVDAAAGTKLAAAQVTAYLREVNEFAARTPFDTSSVLNLSKYMQSVGVAMNQTQSILTVLTDAAAATGATTENLQRITFALGQIMTKGRLANEEIRQLANANIPIYEILQDELGLTGNQISNIGKYWVDAGDSVVAILRGLEKRYAGAADRIADTFAGMTDTIIDDAKIISEELFSGLYSSLLDKTGTLRDTLDSWREIINEFGAPGLVDHWLLSIDPTGQFANEIFHIIGHLNNLMDAFRQLWAESTQIRKLFGSGLSQSMQISIGTITALIRAVDQLLQLLNKTGIASSDLAKAIAELVVAYKMAQLMGFLGQGLYKVGLTAATAATNITALLPASISANAGITTLIGSVASLVGVLTLAISLLGGLSSSTKSLFSGLQGNNEAINSTWREAVDEYKAQREAWNEQVKKYQQSYREGYESLGSGKPVETDSSKDKSGGSSSNNGPKEWVASFDEVYDVPDEDEIAGGATIADVVDSLADLEGMLGDFVFPELGEIAFETPEFNVDLFDEDALNGDLWSLNWKDFLPSVAAAAALAIGKHIAEAHKKTDQAIKDAAKEVKSSQGKKAYTPEEASKAIDELRKTLDENYKQLDESIKQLKDARRVEEAFGSPEDLRRISYIEENTEELIKQQQKTLDAYNRAASLSGGSPEGEQRLKQIVREIGESRQHTLHAHWVWLNKQYDRVHGDAIASKELLDEIKKVEKEASEKFGLPARHLAQTAEEFGSSIEQEIREVEAILKRQNLSALRDTSGNVIAHTDDVSDLLHAFKKVDESLEAYKRLFGSYESEALRAFHSIEASFGKNYAATLRFYEQNAQLLADRYNYLRTSGTKGLGSVDDSKLDLQQQLINKIDFALKDLSLEAQKGNILALETQKKLDLEANAQRIEELQAKEAARRAEEAAKRQLEAEAERSRYLQAAQSNLTAHQAATYNLLEDLKKAVETAPDSVQRAFKPFLDGGIVSNELLETLDNMERLSVQQAEFLAEVAEADLTQQRLLKQLADATADANKQADNIRSLSKAATQLVESADALKSGALTADAVRAQLLEVVNAVPKAVNEAFSAGFFGGDGSAKIATELVSLDYDQLRKTISTVADTALPGILRGELSSFDDVKVYLEWLASDLENNETLDALKKDIGAQLEATREVAAEFQQSVDKITAQLDEANHFLKQYAHTSTVAELLDKGTIGYSHQVSDDIKKISDVIQGYIGTSTAPYKALAESTENALKAYQDSLPAIYRLLLAQNGMSATDLLATGTKTIFSMAGLEDYGASIQQYIADLLADTGEYARFQSLKPGSNAQISADIGTVFEDYVRTAMHGFYQTLGIDVFSPGEAMWPGSELVVQYDSLLSGTGLTKLFGESADYAFNDIKIFGQDIVDTITSLTEKMDGGVYERLNAALLKSIGRERLMWQMFAQREVSGASSNYISLLSRDTDFTSLIDAGRRSNFVTAFHDLIRGAGHGQIPDRELEAIGGKVFSADAFKLFQRAVGKDATMMDYRREVVDQLINRNTGFSFETLARATHRIQLDFSDSLFKNVDIDAVTSALSDLDKAFLLIANNGTEAANVLASYARLSDLPGTFARLTMPATKSVPLPSININRWLNSLIEGASISAGRLTGGSLPSLLSNAIEQYREAIKQGKSLDTAAAQLSNTLEVLANPLRQVLDGGSIAELSDIYGRLAEQSAESAVRSIKYYDDVHTLISAMERMAAVPEMLMDVPAIITSTQSQMYRIAADIANGAEVSEQSVRALQRRYIQLVDTLGIYSDTQALKTGDTLQAMLRTLQGAQGKSTVLDPDILENLKMPITFGGAGTVLPNVLGDIQAAATSGALTLDEAQEAALQELITKYGAVGASPEWSDYIKAFNTHPGARMLGIDIETTGLPKVSATGVETWPEIMQIAVADLEDKNSNVISRMINSGDHARNADNLRAMMNIADETAEEGISDVARAWRNWVDGFQGGFEEAVDYLDAQPTIDEFWQLVRKKYGAGNLVTGYNATGAAGFDMNVLRQLGGMPSDLFVASQDLMSQANSVVKRATGRSVTFKLSELYEMLTGATGSGAHMADFDIDVMTRALYGALTDGTLEKMLRYSSSAVDIPASGAKEAIMQGAEGWRALNAPAVDSMNKAAEEFWKAYAANQAVIAERSKNLIQAGLEQGAKETAQEAESVITQTARRFAETASTIGEEAEDAAGAADRIIRDVFGANNDGIFGRIRNYFTELVNNFKKTPTTGFEDIYRSFKQATDITDELVNRLTASGILEAAQRLKLQGATASKDFAAFLRSIDDIKAEYLTIYYSKASKNLSGFGEQIVQTGDELLRRSFSLLDNTRAADMRLKEAFKALTTASEDGLNQAVAIRQINQLINSTVLAESSDVTKAYEKLLKSYKAGKDVSRQVDELSLAVEHVMQNYGIRMTDSTDDLMQAFLHGDTLLPEQVSRIAKHLEDNYGSVLYASRIAAEAGEAADFAGSAAARAISSAGNKLSSALKSFGDAVDKATYGTLGIIDVALTVLDVAAAVYENENERAASGARAKFSAYATGQTDLLSATDNAGITERLLGSTIYSGVKEALIESLSITGLSTLGAMAAGTAATALGVGGAGAAGATGLAAATGPVGWITAAAATVVGMAANAFFNKTGYNESANIHYDEWIKALSSNEFIDMDELRDVLTEMYNSRGMSARQEEIEQIVNAWNDIQREQTTREMLGEGGLTNENIWERRKIGEILTGRNNATDLETYGSTANDLVRLAAALGLVDANSLSSTGYTQEVGHGAPGIRRNGLTVSSDLTAEQRQQVVDTLSELLGQELHLSDERAYTTTNVRGTPVRQYQDQYWVLDAVGNKVEVTFNGLEGLEAALTEISEHGLSVGEIPTAILAAISGNEQLRQAYGGRAGSNLVAQANMGMTLDAYNKIFGTELTPEALTATAGLNEQVVSVIGQLLTDYVGRTNAAADLYARYDSTNVAGTLRRWVDSGMQGNGLEFNQTTANRFGSDARDITSVLTGFDLTKITGAEEALKQMGFRVDATGTENGLDYSVITSDVALMKQAMKGFVLDTNAMAERLKNTDLVMDSLTVSAADASVLAEAGIQVYGDGTVAFSYARENADELTGAGRTSTKLSELRTPTQIINGEVVKGESTGRIAELSEAATQNLAESGLTFSLDGLETQVTLEIEKLRENMHAALYKLPADIDASLPDAMKKAIANVGRVTEDGYLEITNKQVLAGEKTIEEVVKATNGAWESLSPEIQNAISNISSLITAGNTELNAKLGILGNDVQENITTFADAIQIISPLKKEELDTEILEFFNSIGVTFDEQQGQLYMNISKTGEFYTKGMSLIPIDTWNRLDEETIQHLAAIGVNAVQMGNQMCIDVSSTMDKGAQDIIAAFVDKPDQWALLPETVKKQLADTLHLTEDQMILINNEMDMRSKLLTDNWVMTWDSLGPEADEDLKDAATKINSGFATITGIVDSADVPGILEDEVAVPFASLPDSVKKSLTGGDESLEKKLSGSYATLKDATKRAFEGMSDEATLMLGAVDSAATGIEASLTRMQNAWANMQLVISQMEKNERITSFTFDANGNLNGATYVKDRFILPDQTGTVTLNTTVNADGSTTTTASSSIDGNKNKTRPTRTNHRASGGLTEGLTLTGELGRELAIFPDGSIKMLGEHGAELGDLPAGTRILNNEDTEDVLKYTGGIDRLDKYAEGNTSLILPETPVAANDPFQEMTRREATELVAIAVHDASAILAESIGGLSSITTAITAANESLLSSIDSIKLSVSNTGMTRTLDSSLTPIRDTVERTNEAVLTTDANIRASFDNMLSELLLYLDLENSLENETLTTLAAIGEDVNSINEELINDVAAEIRAAKEDWANATTDEEREAAHERAEAARAQLGYSGGVDGSQILDPVTFQESTDKQIVLQASIAEALAGNAKNLTIQLDSIKNDLSKQSSEESLAALKTIDNFQKDLDVQASQIMTADEAGRQTIQSAIYDGCSQVASAVGAYVRYAENTMASQAREIEGLRSALNSLSSSSDSKATVGAHAGGGLVTGDTLARVGEFGKEEAIIPIEQPSVMAKIGHAIAGAAGFEGLSTVGTGGDSSGVISEIRASSELIAVAINEAMLVLGENMGTKYEDTVSRTAENNQTLVDAVVAAVTDGYSGLTEAINVVNTTTTGLGDTFGTSLETFNTNLGSLIEGFQGAVQNQQDSLTSTVSLANEIIAQLLGTSTQQATEIAGVDDALATVDSTLVNEVAAGILQAKADYQAAYEAGNAEAMAKAHEDAEAWREKLGYETDRAGQFISVLNAENLSTEEAVQTALVAGITETLAGNHVALDQVLNNLFNALGTKETELSTAMQALITTFKGEAQQKLNIMQTVGTVERSNIQSAIYSGCNQVAMAVGSYVRYAENTMASQAREISNLQSALSFARSAASKKGAAGGGVVEHDAFYRLGENNLSEAILPLRNKGIMSDVGETIASFMPESATELRGAIGIMNDVKPVTQRGPSTEDLVSQVAQHVLESVLPAMSGGMSGGEEKTPIYVGTLVADERGLKQLERKLYDIRKAEEVRRN